jgi:drug/metabolite transporter (DMT)-like permease
MNRTRLKAYLYLLATAAIWGTAIPIVKFTLQGIDPLPFLAYRFTIAAIFSLFIFGIKIYQGKKFKRLRANYPWAIFYGLLAVPVALTILFMGLDRSTVLDLTLIGVIGPLLVTAGGGLFFRDHITAKEKTGIGIVLLGVIINSLFPIFNSGESVRLTGNLLLLLFLLADTGSILVAKKAVRLKIKSANLTNLAFILGALVLIPLTLVFYGVNNLVSAITTLPFKYHLGVWYMALLSGNLAYFLYVRGQRSVEVSEAILFSYLQPLFTVPLAIFWLKESLSGTFVLGAIIIVIGLVVAEYKKARI